jgi:hypothetical protein
MADVPATGIVIREAGAPDVGGPTATDDRDRDSVSDSVGENGYGAGGGGGDGGTPAEKARAPLPGEVVILEVLVNPMGSDLGREWIEVGSLAAVRVDLAQLHVADSSLDLPVAAGVLEPGALRVLGQSADPAKNGGVAEVAAYGTRLILNNDSERIAICVGACAGGGALDEVMLAGLNAAYEGHAVIVDRDSGRICPATETFGAAGDFGTPGLPNSPCQAPDAGADASVGD